MTNLDAPAAVPAWAEALHADAVARLNAWTPPTEALAAARASYLEHLAAHPDAASRACAPGHLTASAMIFSPEKDAVALVHHRIVLAWLQPGGHLEPGDATLLDAARREVREELGLEVELDPEIVSLDAHAITCRGYAEPTRHFDVRFVGQAAPGASLVCSDESHEVRWWPLDRLPELFDEVRLLIDLGRRRVTGTPPPSAAHR